MHACKRNERGLAEIKAKCNKESERGRGSVLNSDWSLNIYLC